MANAQVEKMKALGLRHGEKAVVGLAGALCLLFLVFAVNKKTIELTPDEVAAHAKAAQANLTNRQDPEDILKRLEQSWMTNPHFLKLVEAQEKQTLDPSSYKVAQAWVTPEPGAGLIRDMPELIAPTELYAYPGRGGATLIALDDDGKRIAEDPDAKKADPFVKNRRKKKRSRGASMMGGGAMGGMMGMGGPAGKAAPEPDSPEAKKETARKEKERARLLAGKAGTEKDADKKDGEDDAAKEGGPWKEITKGLRWVAITGVLDHKKLRDNYLTALKSPSAANPWYKQLDVQRQTRQRDGSWSDWEDVDAEKNRAIVFNLAEEEEELTPENVRIDTLVDPLPFLKAGYWEKVHVVSLVPKEKREIAKPAAGAGNMGGMNAGMADAGMMGGMGGANPSAGLMAGPGMAGGMGMMGGAGMAGSGGEAENTNFPKSDADTLMIRSLDFTADPDTTYRFRVRIVVFNPNYKHEDVSPGVDTKKLVLEGPWSEATDEATMPADVTAYALHKAPTAPNAKRNDLVQFQIARWNPKDGVTVVRSLEYGPGQIVGEAKSTRIPVSDGSGAKSESIDYNSHQLLLDENGGPQPVAQLGVAGGDLDVPASSLLMRPDGSVVLRNEASDRVDPVRKDISDTYKRELEESSKKRENSTGNMMGGGMMGGGGGRGGRGGRGRR